MNQTWNSFLQTMIQWLQVLLAETSKRRYGNAALMTVGVSLITVIAFAADDLHVGQRTALVAFAETSDHMERAHIKLEEMKLELSERQYSEQHTKKNIEEMHGESMVKEEISMQENVQSEESAENQLAEKQQKDNLKSENIVEEKSDHDLEKLTEQTLNAQTILSDAEHRVLLRIVQAEAGECDIIGKVLVANVILNRMESAEFPDTVSEVVYQKGQFSPVMDGSIDTCKVTEETEQAVNRALGGEDHSEGALYFMNRKRSSKKNIRWFDSHLDYLFRHGAHEFFK